MLDAKIEETKTEPVTLRKVQSAHGQRPSLPVSKFGKRSASARVGPSTVNFSQIGQRLGHSDDESSDEDNDVPAMGLGFGRYDQPSPQSTLSRRQDDLDSQLDFNPFGDDLNADFSNPLRNM